MHTIATGRFEPMNHPFKRLDETPCKLLAIKTHQVHSGQPINTSDAIRPMEEKQYCCKSSSQRSSCCVITTHAKRLSTVLTIQSNVVRGTTGTRLAFSVVASFCILAFLRSRLTVAFVFKDIVVQFLLRFMCCSLSHVFQQTKTHNPITTTRYPLFVQIHPFECTPKPRAASGETHTHRLYLLQERKNKTAIADLDAAETCRLRVFRAIERPDHTNNMWEVAFAYFATV